MKNIYLEEENSQNATMNMEPDNNTEEIFIEIITNVL